MRLTKISLAVLLSLSLLSCKKKTIDKTTSNVITKKNTTTKSKTTKQNVTTNSVEEKLYRREGNTIYFGSYPQTQEKDESIIDNLNSLSGTLPTMISNGDWKDYFYYTGGHNGINEISPGCFKKSDYSYAQMWYKDIDYDNDSRYDYRGVYFLYYRTDNTNYAGSDREGFQRDNGYYINTVYWFKYEPIKWNILEKENGKALLISDLIIDSQEFHPASMDELSTPPIENIDYENNYELSNIRKWLNDDFYNTVFIDLEKKIIETTLVDNSGKMAEKSYDRFVCNNTNDKLFLLSYREVETYYQEKEDRQTHGTDYALSQGLFQVLDGDEKYSRWYLRSPYYMDRLSVSIVEDTGEMYLKRGLVCETCDGIRPAIWIKL